ncbi:cobyrinate a,c-diamide synthase [Paenibacillus whitsoniae]|uniref:Cobyrinate a,c-diamide synthase n=1 Tax=Paenibacillus whitsoniae TaxID=2496558 RepID=A0A3S0A1M9_9BACL|nr:cobyrinate a,c-diamide synthase [Paenibacillus whitsoniae]RTE06747.1 cobyrinate a,c-diamide synthase [Paenibacillus whitsoniae]
MNRRILIAGTGSGVGKTTLTLGLMAAFRHKGYAVQGFKCGPDYIDPSFHTAVTGRASRNLDSWMLSHDTVREVFCRGSQGADISIIEGVMGLFDGRSPLSNEGSTAEIGMILDTPIVLVVNCQSMARSAAAIVKGFQSFAAGIRIVGVIANQVGSEGHYRLVQEAIEQECRIPVLGYLEREAKLHMPERHLGLVPSIERGELAPFFDRLAELVTARIDLERLFELAACEPVTFRESLFPAEEQPKTVTIAIAKDAAFNFYYPENLELLEAYGAELLYFSPLAGEEVPAEADGLYIGGGFPEEFAETLMRHTRTKASITAAITAGMPTLAECGGYMYLTESIEDTHGNRYPMLGVVPGKVSMQTKLAALGYREITGTAGNFLLGPHDQAKGHEFHYSVFEPNGGEPLPFAYTTKGRKSTQPEGYLQANLVAGYTHVHFASSPGLVQRWIQACAAFKYDRYRE